MLKNPKQYKNQSGKVLSPSKLQKIVQVFRSEDLFDGVQKSINKKVCTKSTKKVYFLLV